MPNLFLDTRTFLMRVREHFIPGREGAAQGMLSQTGDVALKTLTSPMLFTNGNILAKKGIRYYVHSAWLSTSNEAADDNYMAVWVGYAGGVVNLLRLEITPVVAGASTVSAVIDVMCDINTAITLTSGTVNYLNLKGGLSYQEIKDEIE